ncbi:hypothetical protein [Brevundimonas sp.]|uniref:hypothetical protein n=1 Tax=Brevundimonas sp. TaxID=1871086 RepID=UPI002FC63E38
MTDAMLEMSLHRTVGAGPMGPNSAVTLRATELSLSVGRERLVDRNGVPSLVGPKFTVLDHEVRVAVRRHALQAGKSDLRRLGYICKNALISTPMIAEEWRGWMW